MSMIIHGKTFTEIHREYKERPINIESLSHDSEGGCKRFVLRYVSGKMVFPGVLFNRYSKDKNKRCSVQPSGNIIIEHSWGVFGRGFQIVLYGIRNDDFFIASKIHEYFTENPEYWEFLISEEYESNYFIPNSEDDTVNIGRRKKRDKYHEFVHRYGISIDEQEFMISKKGDLNLEPEPISDLSNLDRGKYYACIDGEVIRIVEQAYDLQKIQKYIEGISNNGPVYIVSVDYPGYEYNGALYGYKIKVWCYGN